MGALAAAGSRDSTVRIVDLAKETVVATLRAKLDVLGVAFSRDGSRLACSGADGAVRVWRTNDWTPAATLVGHTGHVRGVRFTNDGSSLVTAGYDGTIRRWDARGTRGTRSTHGMRAAGVYKRGVLGGWPHGHGVVLRRQRAYLGCGHGRDR